MKRRDLEILAPDVISYKLLAIKEGSIIPVTVQETKLVFINSFALDLPKLIAQYCEVRSTCLFHLAIIMIISWVKEQVLKLHVCRNLIDYFI